MNARPVQPAPEKLGCPSAGPRTTRGAFTLLELLLALALSVVLLTAVGAAIDLYRRMTLAGQRDVTEARLVRAVIRKIEADIRAVVAPQPIPSSSASPASTTSSSSGSSGGSAVTTDPSQYLYSRTVFGLYGDANSLVLNTLCPHRTPTVPQQSGSSPSNASLGLTQPGQNSSQSQAAPSLLNGIHGDMKVVAYFEAGAGSSLSPTMANSLAAGQMAPDGKPITAGLARLEGDRVAVGYAMEQSGALASAAQIIAPEVSGLSFRYYDGTTWYTTWDAAHSQMLPQAVEMTIALRTSDDGRRLVEASAPAASTGLSAAAAAGVRTYRHVVPVSTAAAPIRIQDVTSTSTLSNMTQ